MDIITKPLYLNRRKCSSSLQATMEDDYNVPDNKPDISRFMKTDGEARILEKKINGNRLHLTGSVDFKILYYSSEAPQPIHNLSGKLSFDESLNLEDTCSIENLQVNCFIEDLTASVINSRKFTVKAILTFTAAADELYSEDASTGLPDGSDFFESSVPLSYTSAAVCRTDSCRVNQEITIPQQKPAADEILYYELVLRNTDIRLQEGKVNLKADLGVFILYRPVTDDVSIGYLEHELTVNTSIDCPGAEEGLIPSVNVQIGNNSLEIKPDGDGEERKIVVDAQLELTIRLYSEEKTDVLNDAYSCNCNVIPEYKEVCFRNLMLHNVSTARIVDTAQLPDGVPTILQLIYGSVDVNLDDVTNVENGLLAEGAVNISVFYLSGSDTSPLEVFTTTVPFSHVIEVPGMTAENTPNSPYTHEIYTNINRSHLSALDGTTVEFKIDLSLDTLVFKRCCEQLLTGITEEPFTAEYLKSQPSMIGYFIQPGDTLWNIAKENHVSVDSIRSINNLENDLLDINTPLLIVH